jgi:hypothetical protein
MRENLIGMVFGTIKVLNFSKVDRGHSLWNCVCLKCNSIFVRDSYSLKITHMNGCKKCGYHNQSHTRLYKTWQSMKTRCLNKRSRLYKWYGGRGISICDPWLEFKSFSDWALKSGYNDRLTIDRINVDSNYCPHNCRWVTNKVQSRNKTNTRWYTIKGIELPLIDWCTIYKIGFQTVSARLHRGMSIEEALIKPIELSKSHQKEN